MKLKNIITITSLSLATFPLSARVSNLKADDSKNTDKSDYVGLATIKSNEIVESDYYDAMHMYDDAFKSIGILPFKKFLLAGGHNKYKKVKVGVLDGGHINFDAIIKPKGINLEYKYYPDFTPDNPTKLSNHATHVATFIGGVSGVNPTAELYSLGSYGNKSELDSKLRWAVDNGIRVINISLGNPFNFKYIKDEIKLLKNNNDLVHLKNAYSSILNSLKISEYIGLLDWYSYKYGLVFINSSGNDLDQFEDLYELFNDLKLRYPNEEIVKKVLDMFSNTNIFIPLGIKDSFNMISVAGAQKEWKIDPHVNNPGHYKYNPDKNFISAIENFEPKWTNQDSIYYKKTSKIISGTSFSAPTIAGLTSLIISAYEGLSDWNFDSSDIKNILALNSIYVRNSNSSKNHFNDYLDKTFRGGKKTLSGYGIPSWKQIKSFFESSKKPKMFKFSNKENGFFGGFDTDIVIKNAGEVAPNHRFKAALSWMNRGVSPETFNKLVDVDNDNSLNQYFSTSADYSLELQSEYTNKLTDLKYGNHEFINSINRTGKTNNFDLKVHFYKDDYDQYQYGSFSDNQYRTLKFYFKEGEYAKPR